MAKSFDKFINKPVKGAKIKEAARQEKKAAVKERREAIEKRFEEKRQQKQAMYEARQQENAGRGAARPAYVKKSADKTPRAKSGGSRVGKNWDKPAKPKPETDQPFKKEERSASTYKTRNAGPDKYKKDTTPGKGKTAPRTGYKAAGQSTDQPKRFDQSKSFDKPERSGKPAPRTDYKAAGKSSGKPARFDKPKDFQKPERTEKTFSKPAVAKRTTGESTPKPGGKQATPKGRIAFVKKNDQQAAPEKDSKPVQKKSTGKPGPDKEAASTDATMPLNKFLAHAGICSRRDAADKVRQGLASVNDEVITEPAFKVNDTDIVKFDGKKVQRSNNRVYILLNKPKDTITTSEDPEGRKTVMDIIRPATQERVYPVGRLDRNTSGVLLLTNDGDLAQQLSHPSFEVRKIYEVRLDKALVKADFDKILNGLTLEDGPIHADSLAYSDAKDKTMVGIEIHSGRNRIVRRMFEHLGYDVRGLDRVMYANLTKKNVERGHWRFLSEKEVRLLKYFNKSKRGAAQKD